MYQPASVRGVAELMVIMLNGPLCRLFCVQRAIEHDHLLRRPALPARDAPFITVRGVASDSSRRDPCDRHPDRPATTASKLVKPDALRFSRYALTSPRVICPFGGLTHRTTRLVIVVVVFDQALKLSQPVRGKLGR